MTPRHKALFLLVLLGGVVLGAGMVLGPGARAVVGLPLSSALCLAGLWTLCLASLAIVRPRP